MLYKTKGVVFRFTRFGETSIIVTIFTDHFGLQSYLVNGVRSKNAKGKIALFQPLTLLEMVVYHRENANINRIKEVKCIHAYQTIHLDFVKASVAMFITEVLNKTVREESHARELCEFLISSLVMLDTLSQVENFHLIFLMKLSGFLGFGPQITADVLGWRIPDPLVEQILKSLISADYNQKIPITNEQRREILDLIISFYNEHTGMSELKSLQVLREILR